MDLVPSNAAPTSLNHPLARAVLYLRMSTEHQKYSIEFQAAALRDYAKRHNFAIVRSYEDRGKSGLSADQRNGLRALIADVQTGTADFRTILVYDVSRWGRFQNADESAYYEFLCRRAGFAVHYCAEQFDNSDDSPLAAVIKSLKRAMAAEYSRELSAKVFAAQALNIRSGFRSGGAAAYGLRRQLVNYDGTKGRVLAAGERKAMQSERVTLVPGPTREVRVVRWIFREFAFGGRYERDIARSLNERGVKTITGRDWTFDAVKSLLKNELYAGTLIWARTTQRLRSRRKRADPTARIRVEGAFEPLIEPPLFDAAQAAFRARAETFSDEAILLSLRRLARQHKMVTTNLIMRTAWMPRPTVYNRRFGTLGNALALIGRKPNRPPECTLLSRALRRIRNSVLNQIASDLIRAGRVTRRSHEAIVVADELAITVDIMRSIATPAMKWRSWARALGYDHTADIFVIARMDDANEKIRDYYIIPRGACAVPDRITPYEAVDFHLYRTDTLLPLLAIAGRTTL